MRALIDTNVVLDLLLDREPWAKTAATLFAEVELGRLDGYLGATTLTTIHYLATKAVGGERARRHVRSLIALCRVAPINRVVLEEALTLGFTDFEDAVLHEAARHVGADAIVTRDPGDFRKSTLRILSPRECIEILRQSQAPSQSRDRGPRTGRARATTRRGPSSPAAQGTRMGKSANSPASKGKKGRSQ